MELNENVEKLIADITKKYWEQDFESMTFLNIDDQDRNLNMMVDGGVVYFLRIPNTTFYKIGVSNSHFSWEKRLSQLNTAHPVNLEIICVCFLEKGLSESPYEIEKFLHTYFKEKRIKREWFNFNEDERHAIIEFMLYELDNWDILHKV